MPEPRSFDFDSALAEAEAAATRTSNALKEGADASSEGELNADELTVAALELRSLQLAREDKWRAEARRAIAESLKQPTTFRRK